MGFTETHQCYGETVTVNAKAKILMHREKNCTEEVLGVLVSSQMFLLIWEKNTYQVREGAQLILEGVKILREMNKWMNR